MNIPEAIETNKDTLAHRESVFNVYEQRAQQLGIEALERLKIIRETLVSLDNVREPLPSETVKNT